MESTTNKTNQEGQTAFVPIKDITDNLEEVAVGHAGIYPVDSDVDTVDVEPVLKDITLKATGGKHLVACEHGITDFVKMLAKDKSNHLPNTIVGVWVHYLTEGIIRDFNRTWTETPYCLRDKKSPIAKAYETGKRGPSKQKKNEIIAKQDMKYWRPFIEDGTITKEQAYQEIDAAYEDQKKWESEGYYFSPKKTEGVSLFDWKTEVLNEWGGDESKLKIYSRHSIVPLIPCIVGSTGNKFAMQGTNKFVRREVDKSILAGVNVASDKEWMEKKIKGWKDMRNHYTPKALHIAKVNQSGKMRDRWLVVDAIRNKDGKQVLLMWDKNGVDGMLE